jgi:hypothetical protein
MGQLNAAQVQLLAEKIVEQIKVWGIAGSFGEFVSRKLAKGGTLGGRRRDRH